MPMKEPGIATLDSAETWTGDTTWIAHPAEAMQRASHALVVDDAVWLIDPVDCDGLDEHLAELGDVGGVAVLLDRHKRDADTIAARHDVAVHVPEWMDGVVEDVDAPVEPVRGRLADTFNVYPISNSRFWQEAALYDEESGTLVVPESIGTSSYFRTGGERIGVHPMKRLRPPRRLQQFEPELILVGHGRPITTGAAAALADALEGARKRTPRLYVETVRELLFG